MRGSLLQCFHKIIFYESKTISIKIKTNIKNLQIEDIKNFTPKLVCNYFLEIQNIFLQSKVQLLSSAVFFAQFFFVII